VELLSFEGVTLSIFFHISCVSTLGFDNLKSSLWLEVSIACSFSVEILPVFKQDSKVGIREVQFLTTGLGEVLSKPALFMALDLFS
jgi:hypothetical protein